MEGDGPVNEDGASPNRGRVRWTPDKVEIVEMVEEEDSQSPRFEFNFYR